MDNIIDFVIPWVDGSDPLWQKEKNNYSPKSTVMESLADESRYRDWENLQYWFRGIEKYAPWVNKIHFVTWGHIPSWLDTTNPKLNIVKHSDFIPAEYLPTFSSHTIELNLHRIEGLAEQFVYFNDDIFLNCPVKPEDFFKNGLPCETAALDCVYFNKDTAGHFHGADIAVINSNFNKKSIFKKNWGKWLDFRNGKGNVLKTLMLYYWPWIPGMFYHHVSSSYLKSTFETVWQKEFDILDETCSHKFREKGDVNQWVMKFWQLAEGKFNVRPRSFAKCYHITAVNYNEMCEDLKKGIHKMLCINDSTNITDYLKVKKEVNDIMEDRLPIKSSFEK